MNKIITIDPSGTGTTGIFFNSNQIEEFAEFKSNNWKEHLNFLNDYIKIKEPNIIVYEHTNFVSLRGKDMTSLFKLLGTIEGLRYTFTFIEEINNIPVNQVKELYKKLKQQEQNIPNLTYRIGRRKGWMFKGKKISIHQLDALIIYLLFCKQMKKR